MNISSITSKHTINMLIIQNHVPIKVQWYYQWIRCLYHNTPQYISFLFSFPYRQLISKCSSALPNIITLLFIYPAPLYTFAIFQCQLWIFEEFLLDALLDLTARDIFFCHAPSLSLSHRCDSHSSLLLLQFSFRVYLSFLPP